MGHFLSKFSRNDLYVIGTRVGRNYSAAVVRWEGHRLHIEPGAHFVKGDALFLRLPEDVQVIAQNGTTLSPAPGKHFWVSLETIDPHHMIIQADHLPLPPVEESLA